MPMLSRRAMLLAPTILLSARHARANPARRIVSIGGAVS